MRERGERPLPGRPGAATGASGRDSSGLDSNAARPSAPADKAGPPNSQAARRSADRWGTNIRPPRCNLAPVRVEHTLPLAVAEAEESRFQLRRRPVAPRTPNLRQAKQERAIWFSFSSPSISSAALEGGSRHLPIHFVCQLQVIENARLAMVSWCFSTTAMAVSGRVEVSASPNIRREPEPPGLCDR
jgi:hypothetical protein